MNVSLCLPSWCLQGLIWRSLRIEDFHGQFPDVRESFIARSCLFAGLSMAHYIHDASMALSFDVDGTFMSRSSALLGHILGWRGRLDEIHDGRFGERRQ